MTTTKKYHYETATVRLPDGSRKYIRAKTKKELEEKVLAIKLELNLGIDISNTTTVEQLGEMWLRLVKEPKVSENTLARLESQLRVHVYPVIGRMKVRDVKAANIYQVMTAVKDKSNGFQVQIIQTLRSLFNMAVDNDLVMKSPVPTTLTAGGEKTSEVEALTQEQEKEMLEVAEGKHIYMLVYTILNTGLRRGEFLGLMWNDIDFETGVIHVRRHVVTHQNGMTEIVAGAKTEAGERDVPMPAALAAYLKTERAKARSVYLFTTGAGKVYSTGALSTIWYNYTKQLSFPVHIHQLRHTYITKLFEAGLDVKEIQYVAGHANPSITLNTYTHYRKEQRQAETMEKIRAAL